MYGSGHQTRSFCYVADLIESFVGFMGTDEQVTGPMIGSRAYNDKSCWLVIELTGSSSPIKKAALPEDDPRQRRPDITGENF